MKDEWDGIVSVTGIVCELENNETKASSVFNKLLHAMNKLGYPKEVEYEYISYIMLDSKVKGCTHIINSEAKEISSK